MKRLLLLCSFLLITLISKTQVATTYTFTQANNTYTPLVADDNTTPALWGTYWDDNTYTGYTLPFSFYYNGVFYPAGTTIGLDSDAWIAFNPGTMTGTTGGGSWISASNSTGVYLYGTANNNGFAGFNVDLKLKNLPTFTGDLNTSSFDITNVSSTANLQIGTAVHGTGIITGTVVKAISGTTVTLSSKPTTSGTGVVITPSTSCFAMVRGTAPYRQFVIQWTQAVRFAGASGIKDDFSFQMILSEGGGILIQQSLSVMYGTMYTDQVSTNKLGSQVGLRGNSTADFNARKSDLNDNWNSTVAATANTDLVYIYSGKTPASGLTFIWSPACTGTMQPPQGFGSIVGNATPCPGTTETYTIDASALSGANYYTWTYSNANGTLASGTTNTLTNTISFSSTSGGTSGTLTVTPVNLCGNGNPFSLPITVKTATGGTIGYASPGSCASSGTLSPTITGTTGGTFSSSPSGLSINATTGVINLASTQNGTYNITYTVNNNGCSIASSFEFTKQGMPPVTISSSIDPNVCTGASGQLSTTVGTGSGYSVSPITYSNMVIPSPTILYNTYTDYGASSVSLPFPFTFYGTTYNSVYVNVNGYLSFTDNSTASYAQNIPDVNTPNAVIALAWADLVVDPAYNSTANISYGVLGTSPNRIFVVKYEKVRLYYGSGSNRDVTGYIALYENSGNIDVALSNVSLGGYTSNLTTGIENAAGTLALSPTGYNYANWSATNLAWRYSMGNYTYSWSPGTFLSATNIPNPLVNNITSSITYTLTVTDVATNCQVTKTFPYTLVPAPTITSTTGGYTCGPGTVTLSATGTGTQIRWYNDPTSGSLLSTGNSFTTPGIDINTTYYVEAYNSSTCKSPRTAVLAEVKGLVTPINVNLSNNSVCVGTMVTANASGGLYPSGGVANILTQGFNVNALPANWAATTIGQASSTTYYSEGTRSRLLTYTTSQGYFSYNANLDLSTYSSATLSFSHIAALEGSSYSYDYGYVEYSADGGTTWQVFPVSSYTGSGTLLGTGGVGFSTRSYPEWISAITSSTSVPDNTLWKNEVLTIPSAALTNQFRIRFRITPDGSVNYYGWLLDNIKIQATNSVQAPLLWSPTTGLYTNASLTTPYTGGNATTLYANPVNTTTYTVSATGNGCTRTSNVTLNVTNPAITSTTPASICGNGVVALSAAASTGTINWYSAATGGTSLATGPNYSPNITATTTYYVGATVVPPGTATLGPGSNVTSSDYVNPFYHLWGAQKRQYLIRASELTALGLGAGNIGSLALDVASVGTTYNSFTISMGNTTVNALTATWLPASTQVYSANVTPVVGINTYTFTTPFGWDGTSNIVIQICWSNNNTGGSSAQIRYDNTAFTATNAERADNQTMAGICGYTTSYEVSSKRPKFIINMAATPCSGTRVAVIATKKSSSTWLGVNTNWNDPQNWCFESPATNTVPIASNQILIPSGVANYPIITSSTTNPSTPICSKLTIQAGANVNVQNGGLLSFINLDNNGLLTADGRIKLFGSVASNFFTAANTGTITPINELEVNNSGAAGTYVKINKPITITGSLIPTDGNLQLNADVTLTSTASRTANIGQELGGFTYDYPSTYRFIIERFINKSKSWHLLATPIQSEAAATIKANWMENGVNTNGYGTWITGTTSTTGFDATSPRPNMQKYAAPTATWLEVPNANAPLSEPLGYMLYVRGNRTVTHISGTGTNATLRSRGKVFSGTTAGPSIPASTIQSMGNPFASSIDYSVFRAANNYLENGFTVWDPYILGTYYSGAYVAISGTNNWNATVTIGGSTSTYGTPANNKFIQSGQAFLVKNTGATAQAPNFTQPAKVNTSRLVQRGNDFITGKRSRFFRVYLIAPNGNSADGNAVVFNNVYAAGIDGDDQQKMKNPSENLGIYSNNILLAVEGRPDLKRYDTIFYRMSEMSTGDYEFRFGPENMADLPFRAEFIDKYANTRTDISLSDTTKITAHISTDALSRATDRFYVVFMRTQKEVDINADNIEMVAYPNPVSAGKVNLKITGLEKGRYELGLISSGGQSILSTPVHYNGNVILRFDLPKQVSAGNYKVSLRMQGTVKASTDLIVVTTSADR